MANATVARSDSYKPSGGPFLDFELEEDQVIVYGGLVSIAADGYLHNSQDTANDVFVGVAVEDKNSTGLSAGDLKVRVDIGGALVKATHEDGSLTIANKGDAVVAELNNEVTSAGTGTNDIAVGKIAAVIDATTVWVKCNPY